MLHEGFSILSILEREKTLTKDGVCCNEDKIGLSERDEEAQIPRCKSRKPVCRRISMRWYVSSPRKDGYERDYKGLQRAQVLFPV